MKQVRPGLYVIDNDSMRVRQSQRKALNGVSTTSPPPPEEHVDVRRFSLAIGISLVIWSCVAALFLYQHLG